MQYNFTRVPACEMCESTNFRYLGLRLNRSTGLRPRKAAGIGVPVKKCARCGLIYSDPRPTPLRIGDHYSLAAEDYFPPAHLAEQPPFDNSRFDGLVDLKPGMKVLDVGAGVGTKMIAFAKAGWDAWGVEPSESFVRYGVERLGLDSSKLLPQRLEEADLPDNMFDVVSFGAVLEHLVSPMAALRTACRVLKPGGIIYAEIPSSSSLLARLLNLYYRLSGTPFVTNLSPMHPPFHLYEFTHHSFLENGKIVGYELTRHNYWVPEIYNVPAFLKPTVRSVLERTDLGDGLTVFLKKL